MQIHFRLHILETVAAFGQAVDEVIKRRQNSPVNVRNVVPVGVKHAGYYLVKQLEDAVPLMRGEIA